MYRVVRKCLQSIDLIARDAETARQLAHQSIDWVLNTPEPQPEEYEVTYLGEAHDRDD